eukprot:NODE_10_length_47437_cov_0.363429.p4 type:complete len:754 gc:universal NODE_10_length_47437_cov_0.363429:22244-24505(+)
MSFLKSSNSFGSLLDGKFFHKLKRSATNSSEAFESKPSTGFLIKDFKGNGSKIELPCDMGEQVEILAYVDDLSYVCRNSDSKIGIIPNEFLNLETLSKFEVPSIRNFINSEFSQDKNFSAFVMHYELSRSMDDHKSDYFIGTKSKLSASQPQLAILPYLDVIKIGKFNSSNTIDATLVTVYSEFENKKILIETDWTLGETKNNILDKFKILDKERYQLMIKLNNSLTPLTDFLYSALMQDIMAEKNIYIRKISRSKKQHSPNSLSKSGSNVLSRTPISLSKSGSNLLNRSISMKKAKHFENINYGTLLNDFTTHRNTKWQPGENLIILAFISKSNPLFVCKGSNSVIDAIPTKQINFQGSKSELPTLEDLRVESTNDQELADFFANYDWTRQVYTPISVKEPFRQVRLRSNSSPLTTEKDPIKIKAISNDSISVKSSNIDVVQTTLTVIGEEAETKRIMIDLEWTLSTFQNYVYGKFKVSNPGEYQLLIVSKGSPTEVTEKIFFKFLSDNREKIVYLKKKNFYNLEIKPSAEISKSKSEFSTDANRDSMDSMTNFTDSIRNGTVFKVLQKGEKAPYSPESRDNGILVQTVLKGRLLGKGNSAIVYLGMESKTGKAIAIKEIEISSKYTTKEEMQSVANVLKKETLLLKKMKHENIVEYYGFNMVGGKLQLLLEYVPGGSIQSMIANCNTFPDSLVINFSREILRGLVYLHDRHVLHRDIKSSNLLIDDKGHCKLTDFAYAVNYVNLGKRKQEE